jgi:hypothetical protein
MISRKIGCFANQNGFVANLTENHAKNRAN